jgi:hypothetical protein
MTKTEKSYRGKHPEGMKVLLSPKNFSSKELKAYL